MTKPIVLMSNDGSATLKNVILNTTFHSINGALQESMHVYIQSGLRFFITNNSAVKNISIFEMGFGTGLNGILSLCELTKLNKCELEYTFRYDAIDNQPLDYELLSLLNYDALFSMKYSKYIQEIQKSKWDYEHSISNSFTLNKFNTCLLEYRTNERYDVIYFDAFDPSLQPQLWTIDVFEYMYNILNMGGVLVTYCAKGQVRRDMQAVGFFVQRLDGPPGKREILRAVKL